ncbi:MAG TPA: peptidylprolyl isomerase [Candidatus Limnocylindria bacterium]|nr:peptidylprolyl isomerase [Candidatus Limnocylindria bacterium]
MSNKTLVILIIIIIAVGAGLAWFFYWQQTKPLVVSDNSQQNQQAQNTQPTNQDLNPQPMTSSTTPTSTPPTETAANGQCVRNFDQAKLSSNGNIKISGRTVQLNVKGFGLINLEFYDKDAPKTVENFLRLADSGYYNCLTVHRVSKGFVIQAGDPNGNGTGGFSAFGPTFADELDPNTSSAKAGYLKGILAMANSGPNTNGSQFFIMLGDAPQMPHLYTIFGKVSSGLDVVDKIGQVAIIPNPQMGPTDGAPVTPVVMTSVKIIK